MRKKIIIMTMAFMSLVSFSKAENVVIEDFTITCGESMTVTLNLSNSRKTLTAFELTLTLPEGLTLDVENTHLTGRYPGRLVVGTPEENVYKLCGIDTGLGVITGTSGALIELTFTASERFRGGVATLTEGYFVTTDRQKISVTDSEINVGYELKPGTLLGDVNNDGTVNVTDVMLTVNYVIGKDPANFILENADLNFDSTVTITDVMMIVNIIISGS